MRAPALLLLILMLGFQAAAQKKEKVETAQKLNRATAAVKCAQLVPGKVESMPAPKFPAEARAARVGGAVEVTVRIDESGKVTEIEKIEGNKLLHGAAVEAAMKARFAPTTCDGRPARISGVLSYNFIPLAPNELYFTPASIDSFKDVLRESPYFEAILDLTDNYRIAFGYGDRNYYPDLPMTRGDFAHQLRLTLDFLKRRADSAKVDPKLAYRDLNPKRAGPTDRIEFGNPKPAYADSLTVLVRDHSVSLFDDRNEFDGKAAMRRGEVIAVWRQIFGADAVPVNFEVPDTENQTLSRGEFALFLQESLRVLTYKLLPA